MRSKLWCGCADEGQSKEAHPLIHSRPFTSTSYSGSTDDAHEIGAGSASAAVADDPIASRSVHIHLHSCE
jgi:hypothetical protein